MISDDAKRIEPSFLVVVLGNVELRVIDSLLIPGCILVKNVEFVLEGIEENHLCVEEQRSIEELSSAELHVILIRHGDEILEIDSLIDYSLLSENLQSKDLILCMKFHFNHELLGMIIETLKYSISYHFWPINQFSLKNMISIMHASMLLPSQGRKEQA